MWIIAEVSLWGFGPKYLRIVIGCQSSKFDSEIKLMLYIQWIFVQDMDIIHIMDSPRSHSVKGHLNRGLRAIIMGEQHVKYRFP